MERIQISNISKEIIKSLLYFDIFSYPLSRKELLENISIKSSLDKINLEIDELINQKLIIEQDNLIGLGNSNSENFQRRIVGNKKAKEMISIAYKYSKKIASFPFVEGVCLSGSISKNYCEKDSDIDYFIITRSERLWFARTLVISYYKLLSKEKKEYFCVNYFVSESDMFVPDNNQFVATELVYLYPTINYNSYQKMLNSNLWYEKFFPNKKLPLENKSKEKPKNFLKILIELIFKGKMGNIIDNLFLNLAIKRAKRHKKNMSDSDFENMYRTTKNSCKRHTSGFQQKVLNRLNEKISEFENDFNLSLEK